MTIEEGLEHKDDVRILFSEYTDMLVSMDPGFRIYLDIQHYDDEIAGLEGKYGRPDGRLYVLYEEGEAAACIALRRLDSRRAELKRLYVRPRFRGRGLSSILLERITGEADEIGYEEILLDTLPCLESAIRLYINHGFTFTERYNDSPVEGTLFMHKVL